MSDVLEPEAWLARFARDADAAGFRVAEFGRVGGAPLLAAERRPAKPLMHIYLSAGIHGDEPAGTLALGALMERRWFDGAIAWHVLPLLNPSGMAAGTRESREGIDLNRDYLAAADPGTRAHRAWLRAEGWRYDLTLALHEDWESRGFYLYELGDNAGRCFGPEIVRDVEAVIAIDRAAQIDGYPASDGQVFPPEDNPEIRDRWPEQLYLREHHTRLALTLETPSAFPLAERIAAHIRAVDAVMRLARESQGA
ncbi:M14 family metallocarboxypeptidase [Termitidicoccus mucosus]|uniref:Succinylglutamate desuccinylase/Aspartoacylase catalytic domain-containing protein n=1 Tax=Termitidicoccus mucosus TaxID=1184151 RepID=A0A178IKB0_9BACT|nr:hypothetical protein AW736_12770 [Opitutaceae bacterium TSB47]